MNLHYYPRDRTRCTSSSSSGRASTPARSRPHVRLDLDAQGRPVGLDIDHASKILDLETLDSDGLPLPPTTPRRHAAR